MAIKLTKNEQKKQKDALKQYQRFLPTLLLKKKQLQSVIKEYQEKKDVSVRKMNELKSSMDKWIGVFGENESFEVSIAKYVKANSIKTSWINIAGVNVPKFENVDFEILNYDLEKYPLWVDKALNTIKEYISLDAMCSVYVEATTLLERELRSTTQRVNLFEKVKIPETINNIKKIQVALQDQQTASVVTGKIAKNKLMKRHDTI